MGTKSQHADLNSDFHLVGNLNRTITASQESNSCALNNWGADGTGAETFDSSEDTHCPCSCDLKSLHPGADEELFDLCPCNGNYDDWDEEEVIDPEEDIERRINKAIEKTIGELLSDVINRCISSSLEDCIEVD